MVQTFYVPDHDLEPEENNDKPVFTCAECKDAIYEGEECVEIGGQWYHLDCLEDLGVRDLLERLGYCVVEAEAEKWAM